jgi:hypothetical protein
MSREKSPKPQHTCSSCSTIWKKQGTTNCWSDPENKPSKPVYCPSEPHAEIIYDSFLKYQGDDSDARLAQVAAKVEGL